MGRESCGNPMVAVSAQSCYVLARTMRLLSVKQAGLCVIINTTPQLCPPGCSFSPLGYPLACTRVRSMVLQLDLLLEA